jgi:alpha-L-fucosidase
MTITRRDVIRLLAGGVPALRLAQAFAPPAGPGIAGPFQATRESLKNYKAPVWFRDAKFGIWAHWGPQSVPGCGDWYARNMYREGNQQYKYHLEHYGHPSKVGYKDVIATWKAEKFDAERLLRLYQKAGAKYFVATAVHHDNFDLWNSKHHRWNAVKMGPKKDIIGMFRKAALKEGLRFGVSEHLERSYHWLNTSHGADKKGPYANVPYDGNDPNSRDLYFEPHADNGPIPDWWRQRWLERMLDLVDNYQPDLFLTDGAMPFGDFGLQFVSHLYNRNMQVHEGKLEAVYIIGNAGEAAGICVLGQERGFDGLQTQPWQAAASVGDWFYSRDGTYKTAENIVQMLVDTASKNGNLLLNFTLRPDGKLESEEEETLQGITKWMAVHSEAIHSTRPWESFGEGPSQIKGRSFSKSMKYTADDIRFTTRDRTLYATFLTAPGSQVVIQSLNAQRQLWFGEVQTVHMLGAREPLKWQRDATGMTIQLPGRRPADYGVVLKIEGSRG